MRRIATLILALGCASAPLGAGAAELRRVAISPGGAQTDVALSFSAKPDVEVFTMPAPRPRLVVDLADVSALAGQSSGQGQGAGPVTAYRYAPRGKGLRLVFDLKAPLKAEPKLTWSNGAKGAAVLRFSLPGEGPSARAPKPVAAKPAPPVEVAAVARPPAQVAADAPEPSSRRRVIVIDPGHGGKDPGAQGQAGLREKDVTLSAGLLLREELEARGYTVVMTREADLFLPLQERVRIARTAHADLFISLHADSNPNKEVSGLSIYTLSERGGERAKTLAESQNWELDLAEPPKSDAVNSILMDLAQRDSKNRSAAFAQHAIRRLSNAGPVLRNTHRNAGFFVLLAPDVPALLIELGFLSNLQDEQRLADVAQRRQKMSELAAAVSDYFSPSAALADAR